MKIEARFFAAHFSLEAGLFLHRQAGPAQEAGCFLRGLVRLQQAAGQHHQRRRTGPVALA